MNIFTFTKLGRFVGLVVVGLVVGLSMTACDFAEEEGLPLDNLVGDWEGSYGANQGETGLTLNVYKSGSSYKAIFNFYNLPGRTNAANGSYHMNVSSDESKYFLKGYEWIERPDGYIFVDLKGTISGNVFSGSVEGAGGTTFRVVKKQT